MTLIEIAKSNSVNVTVSVRLRTVNRETAAVLAGVRQLIRRVDPALSVASAQSIEEHLSPLTAQDRITTQLVIVFGCAALILSAIGLYGVLS